MNELDRYQPDDWSRDGVTTVRGRAERRFPKRAKEKWLAMAAKATILSITVAALIPATMALPKSALVQRAAFADVSHQKEKYSQLRDVEPDYWPRLLNFLDQFPRDETANSDFDPDPFT
ncbi:hypothetical protein [Candidatus Binatus sp.]|uniref:hypothetical protein n=1 Tax=Candidatus Binatus sp. TaxID=2811406 RepID=UPI002F93BD08